MIAEGEKIAATGHSYSSGKCEHCGETDPNHNGSGQDPDTGDRSLNVVFLFVFSALGLMVLLNKKRYFVS